MKLYGAAATALGRGAAQMNASSSPPSATCAARYDGCLRSQSEAWTDSKLRGGAGACVKAAPGSGVSAKGSVLRLAAHGRMRVHTGGLVWVSRPKPPPKPRPEPLCMRHGSRMRYNRRRNGSAGQHHGKVAATRPAPPGPHHSPPRIFESCIATQGTFTTQGRAQLRKWGRGGLNVCVGGGAYLAHESKRNESERAASANVRGAPRRTASQQLIGAAPSMQACVAAGGGAGGLPKRQTSATDWGGKGIGYVSVLPGG